MLKWGAQLEVSHIITYFKGFLEFFSAIPFKSDENPFFKAYIYDFVDKNFN